MSILMKRVLALALAYDLRLHYNRLAYTVVVEHEDGSSLRFTNAISLRLTHSDYLNGQEMEAVRQWAKRDAAEESGDEGEILTTQLQDYPDIGREQIGWLMVFSEHNGVHVFACGDLRSYAQYEETEISEFTIDQPTPTTGD